MVGGGLAIAQAPGNYVCGTDAKVGDAAFLKALESHEKARKAIDAGKAAIFAVRVSPKTTAVAAKKDIGGSSSDAA